MKEKAVVLNTMSGGPGDILEKSRSCTIRKDEKGLVRVRYGNSASEEAVLKLTLTALSPDVPCKVENGREETFIYANRAGILENRFRVLPGGVINIYELNPED